jgi:hypothetical protein
MKDRELKSNDEKEKWIMDFSASFSTLFCARCDQTAFDNDQSEKEENGERQTCRELIAGKKEKKGKEKTLQYVIITNIAFTTANGFTTNQPPPLICGISLPYLPGSIRSARMH